MKLNKLLIGFFVLFIFSSIFIFSQINLNEFDVDYIGEGKAEIFYNLSLSPDNYEIKLDYRRHGDLQFTEFLKDEFTTEEEKEYIKNHQITGLIENEVYEFRLRVESQENGDYNLFVQTLEVESIPENIFDVEFNTQNLMLLIFTLILFTVLYLIGFLKLFSALGIIVIGFILLNFNVIIGIFITIMGFLFSFES